MPCLDLQLSGLLSRSAKAEGGVYARMVQAVMDYVDGVGTLKECLEELQRLQEDIAITSPAVR